MRKLCFILSLTFAVSLQSFSQNLHTDYFSEKNLFKQEIEKTFLKIVADDFQLDSLITKSLTGDNGKSEFSYDEKGRANRHKMFALYKNEWTPSWDIAIEYNDNDKITKIIYEDWNNGTWRNVNLETREYTEKGRLLSTLMQFWDSGKWENSSKSDYTYDDDDNLEIQVSQRWTEGEWTNTFRITKSFIANPELVDQMLTETWSGTEWTNTFLTTFIYDINNNLVETIGQMWQEGGWVDILKLIYKEGNNNEKFIIYQTFNGSEWQNDTRTTMFYDENDLLTEIYCEIWSEGEWLPDAGAVTIELPYGYTFGFFGVNKVDLFYGSVSDVETEDNYPETFYLSQNYPNPFSKNSEGNGTTTIEYSIPFVDAQNPDKSGQVIASQRVNLTIYDILGRKIKTLVDKEQTPGNYSVRFSAKNLSAGVYFYKLQTDNFMITKKMLILE